jgi:hypothetical protein
MNLNLQRLLFILTLSILLWSIIFNIFTGGDWGWQTVAFAWAVIAMMNQYEINQLKNNKDE